MAKTVKIDETTRRMLRTLTWAHGDLAKLAKRLAVSTRAIQHWIDGKTSTIRKAYYHELLRAYNERLNTDTAFTETAVAFRNAANLMLPRLVLENQGKAEKLSRILILLEDIIPEEELMRRTLKSKAPCNKEATDG